MKNPNNFLKQKMFALKTSAIFQMFQALKNAFVLKKSKKDSNGKVAEKLPISKARKWSNFCALFPK